MTHRKPHNPNKPSATYTRLVQVKGRHVVVRVIDGETRDYECVRHQSARVGGDRWRTEFGDQLRSKAIERAKLRVNREGLT